MPETGLDHVPKQALEQIDLLIVFRSDFASKFVCKWIYFFRLYAKLFLQWRNNMQRFQRSAPSSLTDREQAHFDANNWVYAMAVVLINAKSGARVGWDNWCVLLKWFKWIIDMVAYRQTRDTDIGFMVVQQNPAEFKPRCKNNGHLNSVYVCWVRFNRLGKII